MPTLSYDLLNLPSSQAIVVAADGALVHLIQSGSRRSAAELEERLARLGLTPADRDASASPLPQVARQINEYFSGTRTTFDLPLAPAGTAFDRSVWEALLEIPFGETRTYSELANTIGKPKSVRAVGGANGRNPIGIIIPCHRVIGRDGTLTGYGPGVEIKRFLLKLEGTWHDEPVEEQLRLSM
jgi:methylated-DNA-[protein]-cysteine S-methyltransferase